MGPNEPHKPGSHAYEKAVIKFLKEIKSAFNETLTVSFASDILTPSLQRVSAAGTVAAGSKSVSFLNTGMVDVTVLGAVVKPSESVSFSTSSPGETLAAIAYDSTASELLISILT